MLSNTQHNQENSHWQKEEREQNFAFLLWIFGFVWVFGFWGLLIIIYQIFIKFWPNFASWASGREKKNLKKKTHCTFCSDTLKTPFLAVRKTGWYLTWCARAARLLPVWQHNTSVSAAASLEIQRAGRFREIICCSRTMFPHLYTWK